MLWLMKTWSPPWMSPSLLLWGISHLQADVEQTSSHIAILWAVSTCTCSQDFSSQVSSKGMKENHLSPPGDGNIMEKKKQNKTTQHSAGVKSKRWGYHCSCGENVQQAVFITSSLIPSGTSVEFLGRTDKSLSRMSWIWGNRIYFYLISLSLRNTNLIIT